MGPADELDSELLAHTEQRNPVRAHRPVDRHVGQILVPICQRGRAGFLDENVVVKKIYPARRDELARELGAGPLERETFELRHMTPI